MEEVFNIYSSYYDLIYQDKDYNKEADYIIELIKTYHENAIDIIEFGSGTGKHADIFSSKGYNVVGVEPSAEMIKIAMPKTSSNLSFIQSSIETHNSEKTFDVALALFHVISYLNTNDALEKAFKNVHNSLKNGGLFIFDVWYSPAVLTQLPEKRTKTIENDLIKVVRKAEPTIHWNTNTIDVAYKIEVLNKVEQKINYLNETHKMRHFSIPELLLLAKISGFELVTYHEFLTTKKAGADTWGICMILQKK